MPDDERFDKILVELQEQRTLLNEVVSKVNIIETNMSLTQDAEAQHGTAIEEVRKELRAHVRHHGGDGIGKLTPLPEIECKEP